MTGLEWVTASLKKIGVLAAGEAPESSEAVDALAEGNRMLSSWSNEGLLIFAINQETPVTLVAGDATYTLGAAGDIVNRPQEIVGAFIRDGSTDYPLDLLTHDEFIAIRDKSVQSDYPNSLYDDGGYPQRTVTLYPVPSAAKSLVLFTHRALTAITDLSTSVSMPPGYDDALVYNLAVRLAPEYGKAVSDVVAATAIETKAGLKRSNTKPALLRCDDAIVTRKIFNIFTGETTR